MVKIKKTTKKTVVKKKSTTSTKSKSEKPWVKVLNMDVNPDNPKNGFFELDWNKEFVNMLQQNGYKGDTEEQIIDKWFYQLPAVGLCVTSNGDALRRRKKGGFVL